MLGNRIQNVHPKGVLARSGNPFRYPIQLKNEQEFREMGHRSEGDYAK